MAITIPHVQLGPTVNNTGDYIPGTDPNLLYDRGLTSTNSSGAGVDVGGAIYNETGGVTSPSGPTPEQLKLQQDEQTRQTLRGNVSGIIQGLTGLYDQIYGAINSGVGEAGTRLQERYTKETGALADTFNQELPKIGLGYAARGLYDSSYRQQGEADAQSGYEKQVGGLGDQLALDKQAIGAKALEQKAKYQADQGGVNAILARINEVTDINELNQLRNELEAKQRALQADTATFADSAAQKAAYESVAPTADRSAGLVATLQTLVQGSAPRALKIKTAETIIGNSGLSEEEKQKLNQQVTASLS